MLHDDGLFLYAKVLKIMVLRWCGPTNVGWKAYSFVSSPYLYNRRSNFLFRFYFWAVFDFIGLLTCETSGLLSRDDQTQKTTNAISLLRRWYITLWLSNFSLLSAQVAVWRFVLNQSLKYVNRHENGGLFSGVLWKIMSNFALQKVDKIIAFATQNTNRSCPFWKTFRDRKS